MEMFYKYCLDTMIYIYLWKFYPEDVFPTLREKFEESFQTGLLVSPKEVRKELEKYDDELARWATKHKESFIELDEKQSEFVKEILAKFPTLIDSLSTVPEADPFVVALAEKYKITVVTDERKKGLGAKKVNIPNVCEFYDIKCISMIEFFRKMNWRF